MPVSIVTDAPQLTGVTRVSDASGTLNISQPIDAEILTWHIRQATAPTRLARDHRSARCYADSEMFSRHYRKVKAILGFTDSLLISLAFVAAYQTRFRLNFEKPFYWVFYIDLRVAALLFLVSLVSWLAIGYWFNIYEKLESARPSAVLRDTFRQCFLGAICLVSSEYMLRLNLSRFFVLLFATYSWILLCLFRLNAARVIGAVRRKFGAAHFVMVVGSGERARHLGETLEQSSAHGIRLMGFLDEEAGQVQISKSYEQFPLSALPELLRRRVIDEIIFAVDSERLREMESVFLLCDEQGVRTRIALDFFPHVNSQIYLDALGATPLLTFSAAPHDEIRLLIKRITDVLLAASALVLLLPFMLAIALLIWLTSPGPAIFRQERCGLNGRRFTFYKFRSMLDNAEEMKASLMHLNSKSTAFKIKHDPRITRVGWFLRKFSIDEWPQLWNVVKGDMSLVGPRPAVPSEVELYQRWQRRRLRMRPGLTCLWALAGRDTLDFETWMKMDMQYIDTWSLALDWKIILRTIPRVVTGRGAN
jgi:exopolysaccharide biosynthesis polyprenyl glycosylphosphotransferase